MEFTINFTYVFGLLWAGFKGFSAVWITKRELRYPMWNKEGVQIERGLHHKIQAILRNFLINPEWGLLKLIAFGPVFIATGKRYMHHFMPWKVRRPPYMCEHCKDKGKYYQKAFFKGWGKGDWRKCDCESSEPLPSELPDCNCKVCLDKGTIGPNRVCPHCERRRKITRVDEVAANGAAFDVEAERASRKTRLDKVVREGHKLVDFGERRPISTGSPLKRNPSLTEAERGHKNLSFVEGLFNKLKKHHAQCDDPYDYLQTHDRNFCGDAENVTETEHCSNHWKRKIQPTEIQVGDTVVIGSYPSGHRCNYYATRGSLRVRGVCLPFIAIEYATEHCGRHIDVMDVRGMTLYANRNDTKDNGCCNEYQPRLDPMKLVAGDRFVLTRLNASDGSYRGEAFEVIQGPTPGPIRSRDDSYTRVHKNEMGIKVRHKSFGHHSSSEVWLPCNGLQIIRCDDQYVTACKTHCPDVM